MTSPEFRGEREKDDAEGYEYKGEPGSTEKRKDRLMDQLELDGFLCRIKLCNEIVKNLWFK